MSRVVSVVVAVAAALLWPALAQAKVKITVDLDSQTMHVDGQDKSYDWKVSSGKSGYETPAGTYRVLWTDKDHFSDEYDGAPMPNAIFFKPGFAIHGSYKSEWGHPASHGCVRLPVADSAILFDMVKAEGGADIRIVGETPPTIEASTRHRRRAPVEDDYGYGYGADEAYGRRPVPIYPPRDPGIGGIYGQVY